MKNLNNQDKINNMIIGGKILGETLKLIKDNIKPGISTAELDKIAREFIISCGAKPSFLHYNGFPASICTSIDDVIVHGIPRKNEILKDGQIIGIDIGVYYNHYHTDAARTFAVGNISEEKQKLIDVTKQSFFDGIKGIKAGSKLGDISGQVQKSVEKHGFSVVRDLVGHGCGEKLHEYPNVPNYGYVGTGITLTENQTLAIEPMVNVGTYKVVFNGPWDCRTQDGKPSAHYENTVIIKNDGVQILTDLNGEI